MSDDRNNQVGLSRRELEREAQWMLRHIPDDPAALAKLICQVVIALIDKNNAAVSKRVEIRDDEKPGTP